MAGGGSGKATREEFSREGLVYWVLEEQLPVSLVKRDRNTFARCHTIGIRNLVDQPRS